MGEKQSTICNLFLHLSTKNEYNYDIVPSGALFSYLAKGLANSIISGISSANRLGISPVFNILLTSSKNPSSFIYTSVNKNTVTFPLPPQDLNILLTSSLHSYIL